MQPKSKRSTITFDADVHRALAEKASRSRRSMSSIVNEAVRRILEEEVDDLKVIAERVAEPKMSYEEVLRDLKRHGRL